MTRELPYGLQEAQNTVDFWRYKYAEEQKRRLDIEQSTKKAVAEAARKAKADGIAEGRLQASKEYNIWKDGFLAGRQSVQRANTAEKPKDSSTTAAELENPREVQETMGGGTLASHRAVETNDSAELPVDTSNAVAELMTPQENYQGVSNEETQDSHSSIKVEYTAEVPMGRFNAAAGSANPSEGQETLRIGHDGVTKPEEDHASTGVHETHGPSTIRQVGQKNRTHASGNVGCGGRYQGPHGRYTDRPSEVLVSGIPHNRAGREASRAMRGRGGGHASMDTFHNGRGGRQLRNQGNARGDGRYTRPPGIRTGTHTWNGSSYGNVTRAWSNDRSIRSSLRSPHDGIVPPAFGRGVYGAHQPNIGRRSNLYESANDYAAELRRRNALASTYYPSHTIDRSGSYATYYPSHTIDRSGSYAAEYYPYDGP